jgi:hypothetical protein
VTVILAALAPQGSHEVPAPAVVAKVAQASPPIVDPSSGKILDRVGGHVTEPSAPARLPSSSLMDFAAGLDLYGTGGAQAMASGPSHQSAAKVAAQGVLPAAQGKGATRPATPRARTLAVADAAPLPPVRPVFGYPTVEVAQQPAPEDQGLLKRMLPTGRLASKLLPAGKEAWSKVAWLGEAFVDHVIP